MASIALSVHLLSGDPFVLHMEPSVEVQMLQREVALRLGGIPVLHEVRLFYAGTDRQLHDGTLVDNGLMDGSTVQAVITPALAEAVSLIGGLSTADVDDKYRTQAWTDKVCTALSLLGNGELAADHVEALWGFVSASWLMGASWLKENKQVVDAAVLSLAEQTCNNVAKFLPRVLGMSDDLCFQLCRVSLSVLEKVESRHERILRGEPTRKLIAFVGAVMSSFGDVECWEELVRKALRLVGRNGDSRVVVVLRLLEDIIGQDVVADVAAEINKCSATAACSESHAVQVISAAVSRKRFASSKSTSSHPPQSLPLEMSAAKHRRIGGFSKDPS